MPDNRDPYAIVRGVANMRALARQSLSKPNKRDVRAYLAERHRRALAALKTRNGA